MFTIIIKCILKVGNQYFLQITIDVHGEPTIIQVAIPTHVALLLKKLGTPDCCIPSTQTFSNTTPIIMPATGAAGIANPYPSQIVVTGMSGIIEKVTVTLRNINSTYPDDIGVLLVGPQGQTLILMSDVGSAEGITNVTLILDDDAVNPLPAGDPLVSGTFKPANYPDEPGDDNWPAPAPVPPYGDPDLGQGLNVFNGTDPNGIWSLYVVDDADSDINSIAGGWDLTITTSCPE
jgi:subtilisin-like proprotein convertase family protein